MIAIAWCRVAIAHPSSDTFDDTAPAGQVPGTFHLRYEGHVRWTGPPAWPVTLTLGSAVGTVATTVLTADGPFVLEADVPPGTWQVLSAVDAANDAAWWGAIGPFLRVDDTGGVRCAFNCLAEHFVHRRKMHITGPPMMEMVDIARPELRWEPVDGAAQYSIRWFELRDGDRAVMRTVQNIPVKDTHWTFDEDVVAARVYQWDVEARNTTGAMFAHTSGYFLTPGATGRDGGGYLGLSLYPARGHVGIGAVVPGSPAELAGFRANDVVLRFEGTVVDDMDVLRSAIAAIPAGKQVSVLVRRPDRSELTLHPVVGTRP